MIQNFLAYDLAVELYGKCEGIKAKRYIKDQLERASLSIVLNLAESTGKTTPADRRRFRAIAFGSLRETQALLKILRQQEAETIADRLGGMLFRLVHPR